MLESLRTSKEGISESEAAARLQTHGPNMFRKREKKSPVSIFLDQFASPLIFILIGAGIVTFFLQEWVEVVVIGLAVGVNAVLGFYREYHAENTLEKLTTYIKDRSRVIRGGREMEVDSETLVPGDVIKLAYGTRVPADARLLQYNSVRIDEAVLTGESVPVHKEIGMLSIVSGIGDRKNMVHAGTLVVEGFATAVIVATGDDTEIGKIAGLVSGTTRAITPIQKGLNKLAWIIFAVVIVLVVGIFALGISRGEPFFEMLILAAAVSVGAVPEALPIALTVILSIGAERIAKKKGITRTLAAAETLGSATLIMTDKTGTLTQADMELTGTYTLAELTSGTHEHKAEHRSLIELALHNVDALVENPDAAVSAWTFKGKPFEVNIVKAARAAGLDIGRFAVTAAPLVIPFNSTNKFSVSLSGEHHVVMGAPDILLARSEMPKDQIEKVEAWVAAASANGSRLIALATIGKNHSVMHPDDVKHLSFVGVLAFHDPIRLEVPEAIRHIESLGVRVVMITGDLKGTALSVAREIGWTVSDDAILTGAEIRELSDQELRDVVSRMRIFARVTPEDKLRVGMAYRSLGEVVAMTGDGVNDAPALKAMDIGVALGSGSDVAKSAADLVLLDDNFQTVTAAITEGRRILVNIRKTFVYLMANSLDEVFVVGGSLLVGLPLPLTALQIIWVNLFTGSLPTLAFAYDENFDHGSSGKHDLRSIFSREVNGMIFGVGIVSSALLFVLYYGLIHYGVDLAVARSVFFVCFASYILAVAFSFRSLHRPLFTYPIFSNKKLNSSILIATVILIATMTIPQLRDLFDLAPMPLLWLWFVAGWLVLNIVLVEVAKWFFHRKIVRRTAGDVAPAQMHSVKK